MNNREFLLRNLGTDHSASFGFEMPALPTKITQSHVGSLIGGVSAVLSLTTWQAMSLALGTVSYFFSVADYLDWRKEQEELEAESLPPALPTPVLKKTGGFPNV